MLYVIQAVREREEYVNETLKQIPEAKVYWDDNHDMMKAYLHILEEIGTEPCVMMQDDVILTSNFKQKVEKVISMYPEILINFFSLSRKYTKPHFKKGREYCMNQCVYLPKGFAQKILEAYKTWDKKESNPTADDFLVGYAWGYDKPYLVWCPSLVQHREAKSIIDPRRSSKRQSITFEE